jgi:hypothetical protein
VILIAVFCFFDTEVNRGVAYRDGVQAAPALSRIAQNP